MPTYTLTPENIQKLNRMRHLNINPALGGELTLPDDIAQITADTRAIVKAGGVEIKLRLSEAFKLCESGGSP